MQLLQQNPYRVIGVLPGTNQKVITRQKAKINALRKVGKEIVFDKDFPFLNKPDRSKEELDNAFASIELNQNKLKYALFWFVNQNHLDETALNYLKSNDIAKAEEIWVKVTANKGITPKYLSAFNNLGTLKLYLAFADETSINFQNLEAGVALKTELITSEYFCDFVYMVADETYTINCDKELQNFIESFFEYVNILKRQKVSDVEKIPSFLCSIHPKIKSSISETLTKGPIDNIERRIKHTEKARNGSPQTGLEVAIKLYNDTKNDLGTLKEILGLEDLKYKMIADKLAKEILQCGIDYFKKFSEKEEEHETISQKQASYAGLEFSNDLGEDVMQLLEISKSIAVGTLIKQRITENIESLQEWMDNKEKRKKIEDDINFVISRLKKFEKLPGTVENAKKLVNSCKPKLHNIKTECGENDYTYLQISSAVVTSAQGMVVRTVNNLQEKASISYMSTYNLESVINEAYRIFHIMASMDMTTTLRNQFNRNKETIANIKHQIELVSNYNFSSSSRYSSRNKSSTGDCYIATMAYGSYDHPQVLELKKFRDNILSKYKIGRRFIKIYYKYSPKFAEHLKNKSLINKAIKELLDTFINFIK